jgi:hypothetical protein
VGSIPISRSIQFKYSTIAYRTNAKFHRHKQGGSMKKLCLSMLMVIVIVAGLTLCTEKALYCTEKEEKEAAYRKVEEYVHKAKPFQMVLASEREFVAVSNDQIAQ